MASHPALALPDNPRLTANLTHFARALRAAGLTAGPGKVIEASRAIAATGFASRTDFYWALSAVFVSRPEERAVFHQIFRLFWRDPRYLEHMMAMLLPAMRGVAEERAAKPAEKRAAEALLDGAGRAPPPPPMPEDPGERIAIDASATMSERERFRQLDFEQMSAAEMARARRMLAGMRLPVPQMLTRRFRPAPRGGVADWRASLRRSLRTGGEMFDFATKNRKPRWPSLVLICDISGSMSAYSRAVLHYLHAVANQEGAGWARVHGFTFSTRLTNITRHLATRDVDAALAAAGAEAPDWEGGTRIGACLAAFNRDWSRRVLGQGAVVVLVTDGLERGPPGELAAAMERLHLSARRLIWLNPLLRWRDFAPKAAGIRAMLPHVDAFRAGHNLAALEGLAEAISRPLDPGERARLRRGLV